MLSPGFKEEEKNTLKILFIYFSFREGTVRVSASACIGVGGKIRNRIRVGGFEVYHEKTNERQFMVV